MKNKLQLALVLCLFMLGVAGAQPRAYIVNEPVTPHQLTTLGLTTNSVSPGLDVVGNHNFVYLSAENIGDTSTVTNAVFSLTSVPGGSTAALTTFGDWVYFQTDVKGQYTVRVVVTTSTGTDDTTRVITAADYVGVGNFDGVAGNFPKCMTCHAGTPKFADIFSRWSVSGHANIFKTEITSGAAYYGTSCFPCHTTGYNHNNVAPNGGFDEVAASLGWAWVGPPNAGKWDSLKAISSGALVNLATIGCENCHGPGSDHANNGGLKTRIQISYTSGVCEQCHDEPWRHNKVAEFENSVHAEAIWESGFATSTQAYNTLSNCIRCHDGRGYVNFTKGVNTNSAGWTLADHSEIGCSSCHDPHGNTNTASLRNSPASSDTLGNGYAYTLGGTGQTCMNCHKARRNAMTYTQSAVSSSHWGPHGSVQTDILLGQNAATFGTPFLTNSHMYAAQNLCVTCHMYATPDTGNVNRNKVGGHSFSLHNDETGLDYTAACTSCHGPKDNFESFMSVVDNDGDGTIESIRQEIQGLMRLLRIALPPYGVDSIDWNLIAANNNLTEKKAFYNYSIIESDGSGGMHNSKFIIDVLTKSIMAQGGIIPVQMISFNAQANTNTVALNWETATETNNKGFEVERKINKSFEKVGFIGGNGTTTESHSYSFNDKINYRGTVVYRIKQVDFDGSAHFSKEVSVEVTGPAEFELGQNFPNPFNPATKISYSLPVDAKVKVVVYSISGEVVKELVNSNQTAGKYEVEFSSKSNMSSGIYFYSIEAVGGDGKAYRETKKMVLLK